MNFFINILVKGYAWLKRQEQSKKYQTYKKAYQIHETFRFNGENIQLYGEGEILIDKDSYIGGFSTIQAASGCVVKIGKACQISHNVRMYTSTLVADGNWEIEEKETRTGNINIQDYVWIGANVFISPGVTIGINAVVGANSVVTGDIPPHTIYGGVPARKIRDKKMEQ